MKLNNKGFAITAVLYGLLILFVLLVSSYLLVLSLKKSRVEELANEIEKGYNDKISGTEFIIEFNANGGSDAPDSQTKIEDVDLVLSSIEPTRTGYIFLGWSTTDDATSAMYEPGDTYTNNENITLYAVWESKTYTVSYDANGGSGAPSNQIKKHGVTLTLSSKVPTKTGYTFLGWGEIYSPNSNVHRAEYSASDRYYNNKDITLYATWVKDSTLSTYAVYYGYDKSLRFYNTTDAILVDKEYDDMVSTYVYVDFLDKGGVNTVPWFQERNLIKGVYVKDEIFPQNTSNWFAYFDICEYFDITLLNTSNISSMIDMFREVGANSKYSIDSIKIVGLENWNTSSVTNMKGMFYSFGRYASSITFTGTSIENWNTSSVTNMSSMFYFFGDNSTDWSLNLSNWDVSKVVDYDYFAIPNAVSSGRIIRPDFGS